jgi:hypothetical protein
VLHPDQFRVNETWIVFKLNDAPLITDRDGDFNALALMDAASGFILDSSFVPSESNELSPAEAEHLLSNGYSHKKQFPKELIVPEEQTANNLALEAERWGISVRRAPDAQLRLLISDAREAFRKHFASGRAQ